MDQLNRALYFSQLNLINIYHWIRILKANKWKTAFRTRYSYFEYKMKSFGLIYIPAIFQGYINKFLGRKFNIFVIEYLDDIFIYTKNEGKGHVEAV